MKLSFWAFICMSFLVIGCADRKEKPTVTTTAEFSVEIPNTSVLKSTLKYHPKKSLWTVNNVPYSGFAVSYYPDGILKEEFGILNGLKQNKYLKWYPDGHLQNVTTYHQGKLHGEKKIWSSDAAHVLIAQLQYDTGKAHGEQKKWYATGEVYKKLNLHKGKEEGLQQAFRKNGVLYANYEAREGRIFGLKKAALCYGLEDEKVQYENK
ncbi:hypothetical protein KORDIASMS9_03369 [Kordia sp. SMS9]|uniref:toxin-antitoxin system YwqK family antitoxin n=1 Tax=Kordia sp. SMS9 TaxID=2282170 RepID=UPI000E1068B5|nr:membrane-binding protein [Kordia sp. SMS9]AXG71114.1 hypothetical protein KORDIASMS9_03369 [Kordia sp. SMS9]